VATINGTQSSETLTGSSSNDRIWGNGGDDTLLGGGGNDELHGGTGDDVLDPGSGRDKLFGDSGDDILKVGSGDQEYDGGDGFDTFDASAATRGLTINLDTDTVSGLGASKIKNIEAVVGSKFADTITGSSEDEVLIGSGGSDVVRAGGGSDMLVAGAGADKLYGEAGSDTLVYNATTGSGYTHVLDGGSGSDVLQLQFTAAQYTSAVKAEISAFQAFAADPANAGKTVTFTQVGSLQVSNIESVQVLVDGAAPVSNAAPVIAAGTTASLSVAHLGSVSGTIAATDADGDALTYAVQTGPAHGTIAFTDATHYTYTAVNYVGSDSFTLQVSDGRGGVATQVVTVGLTNAAPQVEAASTTYFDVGHNQAYAAQFVVTDADGDILTYAVAEAPQHGKITFDGTSGNYTYQAIGAFETDSYMLVASDGHGGTVTLRVDVTDPNTIPVVDVSSTTTLTIAHNAAVAGVISATDAENDALSYSVKTGPANGVLTFTDATHYTYAAGDYVGADSFTLLVDDGFGGLVEHTVNVDVTNAGPVVAPDSTSALTVAHRSSTTGVIAATDAEGDALTYAVVTGPQHGTLTFTDATHYTYAAGDYVGADSFTLQVSDGHGGTATQVVSVEVTNTGPEIALAGTTASLTLVHGKTVAGSIVASDANGDALTYSVASGPQHGTVAFTDAQGHYTFTAADHAGTDSFTLLVDDGHGGQVTQTVSVGIYGTLDLTGSAAAMNVNLQNVTATGMTSDQLKWIIDVTGSQFNDYLYGDARENLLSGGAGSDQVNGAAGNDTLSGDAGKDSVWGGGGDDKLWGGDDADKLIGDGGNDRLVGGAGSDILTGGQQNGAGTKGSNTFVWSLADVVKADGTSAGLDHITDFGIGDRLDFSGMFASDPLQAADVLHLTDTAAGSVVSADVGGGTFVDVVVLDGVHYASLDYLLSHHDVVV
jgi:Big-like domain-containing protein/hemolysin type calcium-binding protein